MPEKRKHNGEEHVEEKKVAAAAAGSSSRSLTVGEHHRPGNTFKCKIEKKEPGGYSVAVIGEEWKGFLPSKEELAIGTDFVGTFVCIYQRRILFSSKISPLSS